MPLSREQCRTLDRRAMTEFGIPGVVLMENAARGAVETLVGLGIAGKVVICCGKGNNGGDGLVMARFLDNLGIHVQVVLFARPEDMTGDAAVNRKIVERSGIPLSVAVPLDLAWFHRELSTADWIVDALFGTGLSGPIGPPLNAVVEAINQSRCRVFAVDIPSGLDCDTGMPLGPTIRAHHTVTFADLKPGFLHPQAQAWLGKVHVVDIGAPRVLIEEMLGNQPAASAREA